MRSLCHAVAPLVAGLQRPTKYTSVSTLRIGVNGSLVLETAAADTQANSGARRRRSFHIEYDAWRLGAAVPHSRIGSPFLASCVDGMLARTF
jgi:hypothetical protein